MSLLRFHFNPLIQVSSLVLLLVACGSAITEPEVLKLREKLTSAQTQLSRLEQQLATERAERERIIMRSLRSIHHSMSGDVKTKDSAQKSGHNVDIKELEAQQVRFRELESQIADGRTRQEFLFDDVLEREQKLREKLTEELAFKDRLLNDQALLRTIEKYQKRKDCAIAMRKVRLSLGSTIRFTIAEARQLLGEQIMSSVSISKSHAMSISKVNIFGSHPIQQGIVKDRFYTVVCISPEGLKQTTDQLKRDAEKKNAQAEKTKRCKETP